MNNDRLNWFMTIARDLQRFDDTFAVLDHILLEARQYSKADAGTFFLVEHEQLVFSYTHNDTLFPVETAYKYAYANAQLPMNTESVAGACAVTQQIINIGDVRQIPAGASYSFNGSFDEATGYRTVSLLNLPLVGRGSQTLGVMQLINHLDDTNTPTPFPEQMEGWLMCLCVQAVTAVERSLLARDMIHRMLDIVRLSDPMETGRHVERVGSVAAEIYQRWAERNKVPADERRTKRSKIRLAAMLHDVGKVAIPHEVLKKPGLLTPEEFEVIKTHCAVGGQLFETAHLDLDIMAGQIALHHHQKWNGSGYTGTPAAPILTGTDIPLPARITAVADVFDALVSPRCYKAAWTWEEARNRIMADSGTHFDPEVVSAFLEVQDLIRAIYARYPDIVVPEATSYLSAFPS